jgi:hypothetical protein
MRRGAETPEFWDLRARKALQFFLEFEFLQL